MMAKIRPVTSAPVGESVMSHVAAQEAGEEANCDVVKRRERKRVERGLNYVVSVKAEFQGEFRRFPLETLSFEKLEKRLRELYDIPQDVRIGVHYFDADNDRVTIATDQDLSFVAHELFSVPLTADQNQCLKIQGEKTSC